MCLFFTMLSAKSMKHKPMVLISVHFTKIDLYVQVYYLLIKLNQCYDTTFMHLVSNRVIYKMVLYMSCWPEKKCSMSLLWKLSMNSQK